MSTDRYTIWVGNLNYDTRTRDLERLFDEAGRIKRVFHPTGKGYAFIEFERYWSQRSDGPFLLHQLIPAKQLSGEAWQRY
jgi:hypothetical protein